jgi:hypothetical protein
VQTPPVAGQLSPKRKRGHATVDSSDTAAIAKQHLSAHEGDIDLGMLDQEAFARVIASGQQVPVPSQATTDHPHPSKEGEEEEEDYADEVGEDVTYHPSNILLASGDPISYLRLSCLPVLDILV